MKVSTCLILYFRSKIIEKPYCMSFLNMFVIKKIGITFWENIKTPLKIKNSLKKTLLKH